jgi:hypothetical protein
VAFSGPTCSVADDPGISCGVVNPCVHGTCVDGQDNVNGGAPSCDCNGVPYTGPTCNGL